MSDEDEAIWRRHGGIKVQRTEKTEFLGIEKELHEV